MSDIMKFFGSIKDPSFEVPYKGHRWVEFDINNEETYPPEFVTVLVAIEQMDIEGDGSKVIEYTTDCLTTMKPGDWNYYGSRDYIVHAWCHFDEYTGRPDLHHDRI